MPTHDELDRFLKDYSRMSESQRAAFRAALRLFIGRPTTDDRRPTTDD
jgi:hypothetical protein